MLVFKGHIRSQALFIPRIYTGIAALDAPKSGCQPLRPRRQAVSLSKMSTMAASQDPIVRALGKYTTSVAHCHAHLVLDRLSSEELMPPAGAMCRMRSAS